MKNSAPSSNKPVLNKSDSGPAFWLLAELIDGAELELGAMLELDIIMLEELCMIDEELTAIELELSCAASLEELPALLDGIVLPPQAASAAIAVANIKYLGSARPVLANGPLTFVIVVPCYFIGLNVAVLGFEIVREHGSIIF